MTTYPPKITFGEMRESGVRDVLIYCRDHRCSHCADHVRLSNIEPGFVCTTRGKRGADVRPPFEPAAMGRADRNTRGGTRNPGLRRRPGRRNHFPDSTKSSRNKPVLDSPREGGEL
jgi:hypothetical protein